MADQKTWAQLEAAISETFRKWRSPPPAITFNIPKRSAAKRVQSREERAVTIEFGTFGEGGRLRKVKLEMAREDRAIDNLEKIALAVEWIRMAESRKITDLIVKIYRQTHPHTQTVFVQAGQAEFTYSYASTSTPPPGGPYAVLHCVKGAPLEVCEAAYKALVRRHHPDVGGDTKMMQRLNAAIEQIRKEHAK